MSHINKIRLGSICNGLIDSYTLKIIKAAQEYNSMISQMGEPLLRAAEVLHTQQYNALNAITDSSSMNIINDIVISQNAFIDSIKSKSLAKSLYSSEIEHTASSIINSSIYNIARELQAQYNNINYSTQYAAMNINIIADKLIRDYSINSLDYSGSFIGNTIGIINRIDISSGIESAIGDITRIERQFDIKCEELSPSIVSYEGMIHLLFTIIIFLISIHMNNLSEERLSTAILNSQQNILAQIEKLNPREPEKNEGIFYIVIRDVDLRNKPTNKSHRLGSIFPNQKVILLQDKGKWIYIKYFDYIDGVPKTGWALKKYLKRLSE
ncbi:MAG: SH3 domain-containing protein [Desulfobaccales bacterium]